MNVTNCMEDRNLDVPAGTGGAAIEAALVKQKIEINLINDKTRI